MATNYTFAQVVRIIAENKDQDAIIDIGRRFPLLLNRVSVLVALAGNSFVDFAEKMPEYLTALKINNALKAAETGSAAEEAEDEAAEAAETEETSGSDYDSMGGKELLALVRERKLTKMLPKPFKKADMVKVLKEADGAAAEAEEVEEEADEADETANPYEGKNAVELFKECKKRGIKAVPKKPAKVYIDLLTKDDAAKAAKAEEAEDDDWGDDEAEEVEEKTTKATAKKPAAKAAAKKPAKPAKAEEEDDEDWDI